MDIYSFISSKDVAAHCRETGKTWNTFEMAVIIGRSDRTREEKHAAWRELIGNYPDMPTPGNRFGNIHQKLESIMSIEERELELFKTPGPGVFYKYSIFVLGSLDSDNPEHLAKVVAFSEGYNYGTEGWGYYVNENGCLYGDHIIGNDTYEYYKGKLEGNDRLLHYVSLYFKDEIEIASLLNMQCRIMMEHQLNNNFNIDSHGCYIPENLRAE